MATGSKWGAEHFTLKNMNFKVTDGSLESAVKCLKAKTKQAFYAAIVKNGVIHRKTWNGCAFNAAGLVLENPRTINSYLTASATFGDTEAVVKKFILAWDNSHYATDQLATAALLEILERVGIFSDPDQPKIQRRIVVEVAEASTMTDAELMFEFTLLVQDNKMNEELVAILDAAESLVMV